RLIKEEPENIVVVDNFFLGKESNLYEAKKKYPTLKIHNQDASDYNAMKKIIEENGIDVVFNLAIIPLPTSLIKPEWTFRENVNITLRLCELARKKKFDTLIHCSSSEAYGTALSTPMDEEHKLGAITPYAASKAATDLLVLSYYKMFGIDTSIIRPFNNYGPRQNEGSYAGVIPITIKRIIAGKSPIIYGDGEQTRDYIYVTETADATIQIYNQKHTRGILLNVGSGKETSINTLIKTIMLLFGSDKPIIYKNPRPGDVRRHIADISLAKKLINLKQKIDLEEGLKITVDWYLRNMK
ncbi:MAG: GDP-mannose 4,6-dehydratase, partial [Thermoplasmatales archaeon]|nr:GDP-mannose 4,6-dehydratase [Thermoplasmatales archaeon]